MRRKKTINWYRVIILVLAVYAYHGFELVHKQEDKINSMNRDLDQITLILELNADQLDKLREKGKHDDITHQQLLKLIKHLIDYHEPDLLSPPPHEEEPEPEPEQKYNV